MTGAERQRIYRKEHRMDTHDFCSVCKKEKMKWAKLCVRCNRKKDINENNTSWKGNKVGYRCLHLWIERKLGKPNFCEMCRNGKLKSNRYHWANINHTYKRNLLDWKRLCSKCHGKIDTFYRENNRVAKIK